MYLFHLNYLIRLLQDMKAYVHICEYSLLACLYVWENRYLQRTKAADLLFAGTGAARNSLV